MSDELIGQTLAAALKKVLSCKSWGEARKVVAQRRVQLNGNLCLDPARRLTDRDVLKVWKEPLPKPIDDNAIRIVYVDDDLVVVEKPPRVTSARHYEERAMRTKRRQLQPTLEELLPVALAKYIRKERAEARRTEQEEDPSLPVRPMQFKNKAREDEAVQEYARKLKVIAVHRLDRDTSGLMLFARHQRAAERLGKLFRAHAVDRRYQAVVVGHPTMQTFDSHLVRDRGDGHRGVAVEPIPDDAQHAVTHVRPIQQLGDFSVVECKLETGRTHQIRIHLAEAGYPLCGEPIYNRRVTGEVVKSDRSHAPRQALHSSALRFVHPMNGKILKFVSSWPPDLQRWIDKLNIAES